MGTYEKKEGKFSQLAQVSDSLGFRLRSFIRRVLIRAVTATSSRKDRVMNRRIILSICVIVALAVHSISWGQMSPEEAEARLKEREAARVATATQPASEADTLHEEVMALRRQIATLTDKVAALQAENDKLRHEFGVDAGPPKPGSPLKPKSTFASRESSDPFSNGGKAGAERIDNQLMDYFRKHPDFDTEMAAQIWDNKIAIGMPWDAVKLILIYVEPASESPAESSYKATRWNSDAHDIPPNDLHVIITVQEGKIARIDHVDAILSSP